MDDDVQLTLRRCEALVFFEWLASTNLMSIDSVDESVEAIFCGLEAQLEEVLPEPFMANYEQLIAAARREVLNTDS